MIQDVGKDKFSRKIVKAAFPDYKKHKIWLMAFQPHFRINSYWDGGSRSEFCLVRLADLVVIPLPTTTHPYFDIAARGLAGKQTQAITSDRVGNLFLEALPEGVVLVSGGTSMGRVATCSIYANQGELTKLLSS